MSTYSEKLNQAKSAYPFKKWRKAFEHGLDQYTEENCDNAMQIFDDLIQSLSTLGEHAATDAKIQLFKTAIEATNTLNDECEGCLIETGEREELCELTNVISIACGLKPESYGDGEGLASEWRDW